MTTKKSTKTKARTKKTAAARLEMSDVNHHRGAIRWGEVPRDRPYQIRATYGTRTDRQFFNNWSGSKTRGLPRGSFHFLYNALTTQSAKRQAEHYFRTVETTGDVGEIELAYDFEKPWSIVADLSPAATQEFILTFLYRLHGLSGQWATTYSNLGTWDQYVANSGTGPSVIPTLSRLWVANWYVTKPKLPWDWEIQFDEDCWLWWQDGKAPVPGIDGLVDHGYFNGDLAEFNKHYNLDFIPGGSPPPPPPPPAVIDKVRIVGLDGNETLRMRDAIWGNTVAKTWNGAEFKVAAINKDSQGRQWYKLGESIWIASWYAEII